MLVEQHLRDGDILGTVARNLYDCLNGTRTDNLNLQAQLGMTAPLEENGDKSVK